MDAGLPLTPEGLRSSDRIPRFPSHLAPTGPEVCCPAREAPFPLSEPRYRSPATGISLRESASFGIPINLRPSRQVPPGESHRVDGIAFEPVAGSFNTVSMRPLATNPRLRRKPKAPFFKKLPADRSAQRPAGCQEAEVLHSWREVQGAKGPSAGTRTSGAGVWRPLSPRSGVGSPTRIRHGSCSAPRRRSPQQEPVAAYRARRGRVRSRVARSARSRRPLRRTHPR